MAYPNEYVWLRLGTLYIHTVTPLRAPETVSSSIDITMEVMGADDLTFYNPKAVTSNPVVCQGATEDVGTRESTIIGGANTINDVLQVSQDCIGEQINSIKQLMMRSCIVQCPKTLVTSGMMSIKPNLVSAKMWLAATHVATTPDIFGSYIDYFGLCYAFRRGSTRWRVSRLGANSGPIILKSAHNCTSNYVETTRDLDNSVNYSNASYFNQVQRACPVNFTKDKAGYAIQVPWMHIGVVSPNEPSYNNNEAANQPTIAFSFSSLDQTNDLIIQRSAGDDYQFKFWIGVPVMAGYAID